jgi:hypothetical protein
MKKTILLIAVFSFLFSILSEAQINRNKTLISVSSNILNLQYSSVKHKSDATGYIEPDPEKRTSFNLSPKVGFFVANNFAIGIDASIGLSIDNFGTDKNRYTFLGAGPFIRYYIPTKKVLPFFEINGLVGSASYKYESSTSNYDDNYRQILIGVGTGMAIRIGDKVILDIMAGYTYDTEKATTNNSNNARTVMGTIGFNVGFEILLGKN